MGVSGNTVSSFFQSLVAASTDANQVLVGTNSLIDAVYVDYAPVAAAKFSTISIPIPVSVTSQVSDMSSGKATFTAVNAGTKPVSLANHPQYGFVISDFEQYRTDEQLVNVFIKPGIAAVAENANGAIAALLSSANLTVNPVIATTGSQIAPTDLIQGYIRLAEQKVPVLDTPNMSFIMPPRVYGNMLPASSWTQESIASAATAIEARRQGMLREAYGSRTAMDQQMPTTGVAPTRTFTSVYMHKYAIALVSRPLPPAPNNGSNNFCTFTKWKNFSIRITMQYSVEYGGWLVSIEAGFGVAVIRPEFAQLFSTAE